VFAEIEKLRVEGASQDEIAKVREAQFRAREVDLRQNHFWLGQMLVYHQYGWDLAAIPTRSVRPEELSISSVRQAAVRYLDVENYVRDSLLPAPQLIATP